MVLRREHGEPSVMSDPIGSTRALAAIASLLLVAMMLVTLTTGVAQEPFEVVRAVESYRQALLEAAPTLRVVLALDTLFVAAYAAFFVSFGRAAERAGDAAFLRLGTLAVLGTAVLDIVEDQHLFALIDSSALGEPLTLATLRAQHVLSQSKFHLTYVGTVFFALGLPRRDRLERAFAFAVGVPLPLLGAARWALPGAGAMLFAAAQWFSFLGGFLGASIVVPRYAQGAGLTKSG
jgi:hypothetical protein